MSFKENLLKKIDIKAMSKTVIDSIGPPESGRKVDKAVMRRLLAMGPYTVRKERDLELYLYEGKAQKPLVLVLDNDLPFYRTTVDDVVLRKSPTVKEMISVRNIIRILNDSDVVVSKKQESVQMVMKECIDLLDLTYQESDLDEIVEDGIIALKLDDSDDVIQCLALFSELLGFEPPPAQLQLKYYYIAGELSLKGSGKYTYGPVVLFSMTDHSLRLMEEEIQIDDKAALQYYKNVAGGKQPAAREGEEVIRYLKRLALFQKK